MSKANKNPLAQFARPEFGSQDQARWLWRVVLVCLQENGKGHLDLDLDAVAYRSLLWVV
jgi:hypothetical protein